ncbi:MAG: hypothetical protein QNK05_00535 [Myxococcota bacterium]|nr:hypothetical protein [Myxococcota bacterium]
MDPTRGEPVEFSHRVRPGDEGLHELCVLGTSSPDWPLELTRSMAQAGASLIEGHIKRGERFAERRVSPGGRWQADLVIDPGPNTGLNTAPDYGAVLTRPPVRDWTPTEPRLIDYQLAFEGEHRLHLEAHAWDALGLLAGVMERACADGLHIQELLLETEGECAFHHLVLVDPRGSTITRVRSVRLDRRLAKLGVG